MRTTPAAFRIVLMSTLLGTALVGLAQDPPTQKQINAWVQELSDDRFAVREAAQQQLVKHLGDSLPALIQIAETPNTDQFASESSDAVLQFLGIIAQDALSDQGKLAYGCLTRISQERTTQRAIMAQKIIQSIAVEMRQQALDRLERVGVVCADRHLSVLTQLRDVKNALVIDEQFTGTEDDLALLPWLFDVQFVKLEGSAVSRRCLRRSSRSHSCVAFK